MEASVGGTDLQMVTACQWGGHERSHFSRFFFLTNKYLSSLGKGQEGFPLPGCKQNPPLPLEEGRNKSPLPLVRRAGRPLGTRILYQDKAEVSCHGQGWLRERTVFFLRNCQRYEAEFDSWKRAEIRTLRKALF